MESQEFELLSSEGNEIIGASPQWLILWGNSVIFLTVLVVLGLSCWIKCPSIVSGQMALVPHHAPVVVQAQAPAISGLLLSESGTTVRLGQAIAVLRQQVPAAHTTTYRAPIAGHLLLLKDLTHASQCQDSLFAIVPTANDYQCIVHIPDEQYEAIAIGQRVLLALKDYPSAEYGKLVGQVSALAMTSEHGQFRVVVRVLTTRSTNNRLLPVTGKSLGYAEILVRETTLFERISQGISLSFHK
jgi:hypothetical protein